MLQLRPFLNRLSIKTTANDIRPFDIDYVDPDPSIGDWGWAQRPYVAEVERQYNAGQPVRIIVLKARQLGISTATEAILFMWAFLHRGTNSLVLSYEDGQAMELFQMMKTYWETWPFKSLYNLQYDTKRQLRWLETRSQVRVATAKNVGGSRGSTVHALHASEVAFWLDPEPLWVGLNQTIPTRHGTIVVLESTANGVGNWFHEMWMKADEGSTDFIPMFFPWFRHEAYRSRTTLTIKSELSVDERKLLRLMKQPTLIGTEYYPPISEDDAFSAIAWRRWAIPNKANNDIRYFMQEYPATPSEAFIATGKRLFPVIQMNECYERIPGLTGRLQRDGVGRVQFLRDPDGPLTIYRRPNPKDERSDRYFIGGDPSMTVGGDPGCMQVINRQTYEQVAVWHSQTDPYYFAEQMILLGDFYNHCMICPEVEGGGQGTIGYLKKSGYDNLWTHKRPDSVRQGANVYGWSTSTTRKNWAISALQHRFIDHSLLLHDVKTYNQLNAFVEHDDGYWGNANKNIHDDAVMALAIAVVASEEEGPFLAYNASRQNPIVDLFNSGLEDYTDRAYDIYNQGIEFNREEAYR